MKTIELQATVREDLGKKASRDLRRDNQVPCVMYGGEDNLHFHAHENDFRDLIYRPELSVAAIQLSDGRSVKGIVKDYQFHPVTDKLMHVDFKQLVDGQTIRTDVPLRLKGTAKGVRVGGTLVQKIRKVTIVTTPEHLSAVIEADITNLELGRSMRIRDIKVDDNIEITNAPGIPIASIEIPRALRSAQTKAAAEAKKK